MTYKDVALAEMDLPALLARAPELALIDELAHTNAPGCEHGKRYEDVADALAAGIDVFSTVNVQHLESLNDQVAELTGVRVRETFPDSVLSGADQVVLIDITPGDLIERLRAGKIYKPERVPAALNGFFRIENLEALREVALRQVAEGVEAKRLVREAPPVRDDGQVMGQRSRRPSASGCSRSSRRRPPPSGSCGARGAPRSGSAPSSTSSPCSPPGAGRAPRRASRSRRCGGSRRCSAPRCCSRRATTSARSPPASRASAARTYVLIGTPAARGGLRRFAEPLTERLLRRLPGVDLRVVADRTKRDADERARRDHPARGAGRRRVRGPAAARAPRAPPTRRRARPPRSSSPSSGPSCPSARSRRRCGSRARRTPRRARLPGLRAAAARPRRAVRAHVRGGVRRLRGDRAAGRPRGVPVDSRIARGRNVRHALRQLIADVPAQRIVVAAADNGRHDGFSVDDIAWLLRNAPHEVVVLRPDPDRRGLAAAAV